VRQGRKAKSLLTKPSLVLLTKTVWLPKAIDETGFTLSAGRSAVARFLRLCKRPGSPTWQLALISLLATQLGLENSVIFPHQTDFVFFLLLPHKSTDAAVGSQRWLLPCRQRFVQASRAWQVIRSRSQQPRNTENLLLIYFLSAFLLPFRCLRSSSKS